MEAFQPAEYLNGTPNRAIRDEVHSYLAEYRFKLPEYRYTLTYLGGHLRDTYTGEPMIQKASNAIELRKLHEKSASREEAEYQGLQKLDEELQYALPGDYIIWVSPPGNKADGYGDYGFIFSGTVCDNSYGEKHIEMTAFRIEEASVDAYNKISSIIRDEPTEFDSPEEFLSQPFILHHSAMNPDVLLRSLSPAHTIDQKQFGIAMGVLEPLIQQFIQEAGNGSPKKRLRQLFYAIENLAIELSENINFTNLYALSQSMHSDIEFFVQKFGAFKPPITGGSCGSSGEDDALDTLLDRNIMNRLTGHILSKILGDDEGFECPRCHFKTKEPVGNRCPGCKLTKEQAATEGFATC